MANLGSEILNNPLQPAPAEIIAQISALEIMYHAFDASVQTGIIEVNRSVQDEVLSFFSFAFELKFPIEKVVRASDEPYLWDDSRLMADNVTSGFNYRKIADTDTVSQHGYGRAFDVNTVLNPYIRFKASEQLVAPAGAVWNATVAGTLYAEHPLVRHMESLGWSWGGNWDPDVRGALDYQHFEKPLAA